MTTTAEVREGLAGISNTIGNAVTAAKDTDDPFATLVAHLDQVRGFIDAMSVAAVLEPEPPASGGLLCAACIQEARNAEASEQTPLPVLPAATIINGLAFCDVEGRHRIVTAVQHAAAQAGGIARPGLILPGQLGMNGQG